MISWMPIRLAFVALLLAVSVTCLAHSTEAAATAAMATPLRMMLDQIYPSAASRTLLITAAESEYITERYQSGPKTAEIRQRVPRWGGPSDLAPQDSEYQRVILNQIAPGIVLAVLTIFMWSVVDTAIHTLFDVAHHILSWSVVCESNLFDLHSYAVSLTFRFLIRVLWSSIQCCCASPKARGYSRNERLIPLVIGAPCAAMVVLWAILGANYSEDFHSQLSGSDGLTHDSNLVVSHILNFFDSMDLNPNHTSEIVVDTTSAISDTVAGFSNSGTTLPTFISNTRTQSSIIRARDPIIVNQADPGANPSSTGAITYDVS
jgi:hypothetical protein